ncbi:hypothetical protein [Pusillimonas sp.]|uniref:hypothetical protein n=1 Tax=Pusillimonas sp. TaxID=3040095 RepID=UPI0029BEA33D|nr:hypothetical protein [Pusillimonas sp.]MDX3896092.1 hypothetical protein [Pusillimonas sp.]
MDHAVGSLRPGAMRVIDSHRNDTVQNHFTSNQYGVTPPQGGMEDLIPSPPLNRFVAMTRQRGFFPCLRGLDRGSIYSMNRAAYAFFYFYAFPTPLVEEGKRSTH